jgi:hypothetical protein
MGHGLISRIVERRIAERKKEEIKTIIVILSCYLDLASIYTVRREREREREHELNY